jgi:hypothetical protein
MSKHYILTACLFWVCSIATAQVMLPAFQGVYTKPIAIASSMITTGLVLHLDASNAASYPGSGTTWTDLSGNGNNGTLTSGVSFTNSNGGTLAFAGTNYNRVQTNLSTAFTDFTVGIWFKDQESNPYERLIDKDYTNGFWLGRNASLANSWGGGIRKPDMPYGKFIFLTDGQWHFIITVRSGTTHTIYGDGVTNKVSDIVANTPLNNTSLAIGDISGGLDTRPLKSGIISQVFVYNRALSETEIMQIFNATKSKYEL